MEKVENLSNSHIKEEMKELSDSFEKRKQEFNALMTVMSQESDRYNELTKELKKRSEK